MWWHQALKRGQIALGSTCDECMEKRTVQTRQLAGCGYLPPLTGDLKHHLSIWKGDGYAGPDPTICPGYSTNLPEVQEIARGHHHWTKGALAVWLRGTEASEALLIGIEIIASEVAQYESWSLSEASKSKGQR